MNKLFLVMCILLFTVMIAYSQDNRSARTIPVDDGVCTNCSDTADEDTLNPVYILPPETEKTYNDFMIQAENGSNISISDFFVCVVFPALIVTA